MVKVAASMSIKAESINEYLEIVKELVEKTNALDKGCIKYELCRDKADPTHFMMMEEWEDQESLDNHMKAAHFTSLIPKVGALSDKPTAITALEKVF